MAGSAKDAPSTAAAVRKQAGLLIGIQLALGIAILAGAILAAIYGAKIKSDADNALNIKRDAELAATAAKTAETAATEHAAAVEKEAEAYATNMRRAGEFIVSGLNLLSVNTKASAERAVEDLGKALDLIVPADSPAEALTDGSRRLGLTVERNIARARWAASQRGEAWIALNAVIDKGLTRAKDGELLAPESDLAADYVLRMIYGCANDEGGAAMQSRLAKAEPTIRQLVIADARTRPGLCAAAKQAVAAVEATTPSPSGGVKGPASNADAFHINEIYLHVANEADRKSGTLVTAAGLVRDELKAMGKGYKVLGIQHVDPSPDNRSIRYYYTPQEAQAHDIGADTITAVKAALAKLEAAGKGDSPEAAALKSWLPDFQRFPSLDGKYERLPLHRIEVWF